MIEGRDFVGVVPGKNLEVLLLRTKIAWKWMKAVLHCCKQCGSFGIRIRRQPNRSTPWMSLASATSATSAEQFEHYKCCKSIQIIGRFTIHRGRICGRAKPDKAARCNKPEDWEIERLRQGQQLNVSNVRAQAMAPVFFFRTFWKQKWRKNGKCEKCESNCIELWSPSRLVKPGTFDHTSCMAPCRAWLRAVTDRRRVFSPSLASRSS